MPRSDMTTVEGRAGLSARLSKQKTEAGDMDTSDGLGASLMRSAVYRAYHAGMHADYETAEDLVEAFEGKLASAAYLGSICSMAEDRGFWSALLNDGSKFLVEYTRQRV